MRVFAEKLPESLSRQLKPVYLVFGNEPLLIQESREAVIHAAQQQGFDEIHRFTLDNQVDWHQISDCFQALSLFSSRQIIQLELPDAGMNASIAKELLTLSTQVHADTLLMLIGQKLTKAQENAKWFKTLSGMGDWVSCLTPDIQRLPQFVQLRCQKLGLKPDREALQMLAQWHEGNLLALVQSLEKLTLLYPDGELTLIRLQESLSRNNHFAPFHWCDALLMGKANRAQRILRQLQAEDTEAIILLRSIQKELLLLLDMQNKQRQQSLTQIFDAARIWNNKRPLYQAALQRLTPQRLGRLIGILNQAELLAKTQYEQSPWPLIQQLSMEMCLTDTEIKLVY